MAEGNGCQVYLIPGNTKHSLQLQGLSGSIDYFTSLNASQIDNKVDDNKPSNGKFDAVNENTTNTIVQSNGTTFAATFSVCSALVCYNFTEAKYNFSYVPAGVSRLYLYLLSF